MKEQGLQHDQDSPTQLDNKYIIRLSLLFSGQRTYYSNTTYLLYTPFQLPPIEVGDICTKNDNLELLFLEQHDL